MGLLDIFGFEKFGTNSLEQLCINYANEKLQAQFIGELVANQRHEYEAEGVPCGTIAFPDNSAQLALLEGRPSVLGLLDEECALPQPSEAAYVAKLHTHFDGTSVPAAACYERPPRRYRGRARAPNDTDAEAEEDLCFTVKHYADQVTYTAHGWLDKNRGG